MRTLLIALCLIASAASVRAADFDILGLRLGMGMDDGPIDAVYENALKPSIAESGQMDMPYGVIRTKLKDGTLLYLHFTAKADGRKLFAIVHIKQYGAPNKPSTLSVDTVLQSMQRQLGAPSVSVAPAETMRVMIYAEKGSAPVDPHLSATALADIMFADFPSRVRLLGPEFKGAIVMIAHNKGVVSAIRQELWDHQAAARVLAVPEPPAAAR